MRSKIQKLIVISRFCVAKRFFQNKITILLRYIKSTIDFLYIIAHRRIYYYFKRICITITILNINACLKL